MSTSMLLGNPAAMDEDEDDPTDSDEAGIDLMGNNTGSDSSEEEEEDSEAEREVRKDFIVDEDESSSRRRRKKKRRKHRSDAGSDEEQEGSSRKRRKDSDDEDLDEDDLALLEENTGVRLTNRGQKPGKLKRLRRRRSVGASDDDAPAGLNNIFDDDDERGAADDDDDDDDLGLPFDGDEMAGFIEDDTASESDRQAGSDEDEDERAARREAKRKARLQQTRGKRGRGFGSAHIEGITAEAWQEVTEVFGNGQDYAWALDDDDDEIKSKELKDIYEPSEIASRMLTEEDEAIRALDIPERLQVTSVGLPTIEEGDEEVGIAYQFLMNEDLDPAAEWMSTRISTRAYEHFVLKNADGNHSPHYEPFLQAIKSVVRFINIELLEVPFIWAHRADYLVYRGANDRQDLALLDHNDLWRISVLSVKYRALVHRKRELKFTFDQLEVEDEYFDEILDALESVEEVSDANTWLSMKYAREMEQLKATREQESDARPRRRATRESIYQSAKKEFVSDLAIAIGISATELARDFVAGTRSGTTEDPSQMPLELAATYTNDEFRTPERALDAAKMIAVHEIWHDPMLRREIRRYFKEYAVVTVTPTDKGVGKIDEMNPFYAFKYLRNRPLTTLLRSAMYLQILAAEREGLVKSQITLPESAMNRLMDDLTKIYTTDYTSTLAEEWNKVRVEILQSAVTEHMLPFGEDWARNYIREEEEEFVGRLCKAKLEDRVNVAPYCRTDRSMEHGEVPTVLAISNGHGDPKRDSVHCVYLDAEGHVREHLKVDTLHRLEDAQRESMTDLLRRRRPQVVVIGGFSPNTNRLYSDFRMIAQGVSDSIVHDEDDLRTQDIDENPFTTEQLIARANFETTYVHDDVARLYQNSQRAAIEFPELPVLSRYCVGLARYAQSPLNEYAALGEDLVALTYDANQKFLHPSKVKEHLERALIDVTNRCGVDINKAVRNAYYRHLLPYVAGLGPRKASGLIKKIESNIGGTLSNRSGLISHTIMTKNVWMNAAGFLRISQDDLNADLSRRETADDEPEVLDDTRIHPEDYEVARKMAADAMEVDEEETASFKVPSQAVINLMTDDPRRLDDLSLDDFAAELQKLLMVPKRLTLYTVRDEMQDPYADRRPPFLTPSHEEVFAMLTGETRTTLDNGLIIPARVVRFRPDGAILVRLDSGIEGTIEENYRTERPEQYQKPRMGQTLQGQVIGINLETFTVELSTQESLIAAGDAIQRRVPYDPQWYDVDAATAEQERQAVVQKKASGPQKRMISHPNFQNLTAGQAEEYLANAQRGDCVIRPSSREDHIAVTWKVADGVYQHLAVHEMNKANEWSLGTLLRITKPVDPSFPNATRESYWSYSDLDELIVSHVKQLSLKANELMAHEKYKGTKAQLEEFLSLSIMASPNQSAYGFAIDTDAKKAGQFMVCFRVNDASQVYSWPIKIVPGAFVLHGAEHGDITALCNGFKRAYQAQLAAGGARLPARTPRYLGNATPHGAGGGGRTPNPQREQQAAAAIASVGRGTPVFASGRTPLNPAAGGLGGRTPMAVASGRTPNPYMAAGGSGKTPNPPYGERLDPRAGGRTPNPYTQGGTPQYGAPGRGTSMGGLAAAGGRTPVYPNAGNRTPAYPSSGTGDRWGRG